jgi:rhomboid protease GluP
MKEFQRYPLTYSIIALNSIFFLLSVLLSGNLIDINLKILVNLGALYGPLVVLKGEWWRLLSAMFLHGGMTHILMNMVSLYIIGRGLEIYFSKTAYISIYLLSGLMGGMASLYMHTESVGIGASGAIFGVFGALAGFLLARRHQIASGGREIMKDFAAILGLNLLLGLSIESIDMSAHIGGLIVGLIGGFVIAKSSKGLVLFIGMGIAALILGAGFLYRYYVQIYM